MGVIKAEVYVDGYSFKTSPDAQAHIGAREGYYTFRKGREHGPIFPQARPITAPRSSFHIEERIIREIELKHPRYLMNQGEYLTIDLVRGNDSLATTRPCTNCTRILKHKIPLATIRYKVNGKIVTKKVSELSIEEAAPSSGARARGRRYRL